MQPFRQIFSTRLLLASTALAGLTVLSACGGGNDGQRPTASTTDGPVRGAVTNGVSTFLGIPYAAPPVSDLRWKPPALPAAHGLMDAVKFGNRCAQTGAFGVFATPSEAEDCLYLNVFAPAKAAPDDKRPVIVWIHGGGNLTGESDDYDAGKLAAGGPLGTPTVVVTLNYRLGLFGYLAHPGLNAEGHPFGNYGTMDIQAALRWVQRNIAAFGGDPTRVTLGGQSAGAVNTNANMISPLSAGLFHRAIQQSSPSDSIQFAPLPVALEAGKAFAEAAGCRGTDASVAACLRALSAPRILELQGNGPYAVGTMVDGIVIPVTPETAWVTGRFNRVPVLGGSTRDEWTFVTGIAEYFANPRAPVSAAQYTATVNASFSGPAGPLGTPPNYPPDTAEAVLARYPLANYPNPGQAESAALTDSLSVGPCRSRHVMQRMSNWVPVYAYQFNYRNAPYYFPDMPGFEPLAAHTIDIQFIFPGYHGGNLGVNSRPLNAQENALSDQMVAAWTNFAGTGNPNGSGNSPWPRYTTQAGAPAILSQNLPVSTTLTDAQLSANHQCDFWETILIH